MMNQVRCCTLGKLSLGEFSPRKGKFWQLEQTKPARIIRQGNVHAQISLEIAHVSLFAGYRESEVASNTRHFSWIRPVGCFFGDGETIIG